MSSQSIGGAANSGEDEEGGDATTSTVGVGVVATAGLEDEVYQTTINLRTWTYPFVDEVY